MKVEGAAVLNAPVDKVWDALLDPSVLVATIPGCERLEATGENAYAMTVTAGVATIKGTYAGTCELSDLTPHESLLLKASGSGAPGTVGADVRVRFTDRGDGTTGLAYEADAVIGGMIGGVGQRMLTSVSKRMAGEFFGSVDRVLAGESGGRPGRIGPGRAGTGRSARATGRNGRLHRARRPRPAPAASTTSSRAWPWAPPWWRSACCSDVGAAEGGARWTSTTTAPRATWRRPYAPGGSRHASCSSCTSTGSTRSTRWSTPW